MKFEHLGFFILPNGKIECFGKIFNEEEIESTKFYEYNHMLSARKVLEEKLGIILPENIMIVDMINLVLEHGICTYLNTEGEENNRYGLFCYKKNISNNQKETIKQLYSFFDSIENLEIVYENQNCEFISIQYMYDLLQIYDYESEDNLIKEDSYDIFKDYTGDWNRNTKRLI